MYTNRKENDWELRKRLRLEQVRQQSKEFANELRNKVFNEQKLKLQEIEVIKQAEHKNWKRKSLNELNKEYIECLKNVGVAQTNALIAKKNHIEEKTEKPAQKDNICFNQKEHSKDDKLFPAIIKPVRPTANAVANPKYKKPVSTKVRPLGKYKHKGNEYKNTRTEHVASYEFVDKDESDNDEQFEIQPSAPINTTQANKDNAKAFKFESKPPFSQITNLMKKSSLSKNNKENDMLVSGLDSKPHFSQISNLLKKTTASHGNIENGKGSPPLINKPHFSQVSNLLKQRQAGEGHFTTTADVFFKESAEIDDLKRRPSVVSFKPSKDATSVVNREMSRQPMVLPKNQSNDHLFNDESRQPLSENKVQMYDNRTKFAKQYVPQQSLTQRTSTNPNSPNAMELADQENKRIQVHLNLVNERLRKDLERGENAMEREKLMRKYKIVLNELEKLSTEEKILKTYINSHQLPQYEPKIPNMSDFLEKRTIITSSEVRNKNCHYINVASIRSTSSSRSDDSRKSVMLEYEDSLILENLSESNVNADTLNRFASKAASSRISETSTKQPETHTTHTRVTNKVVYPVKMSLRNLNSKKLFDTPIKITIQIQQSDRPEPEKITPKESNLRISQLESNSSSLTEYRSLPKTVTGSRPPTEQTFTGISMPSEKLDNSVQTYQQIVNQAELECYIRRLLQMSKESVDDLPSVTDLSSIRESIVDTTSNIDESKIVGNTKTHEKSIHSENRDWRKEKDDFNSNSSFMISESSSLSTKKHTNLSIRKPTSYSILSNSSEKGKNTSNQINALSQNYNQRIIELTDLMSKVRIERQQILERISLSSDTVTVPNNSTEYHELPSRLALLKQKLPSASLEILENNKSHEELQNIMEPRKTEIQSKLENSSTIKVDKMIGELFTQSLSDPKIEIVPYQFKEAIDQSDSEESLLDVYAELKRRNILSSGLRKLGTLSEYRKISPKPLQPNDDQTQTSIGTSSLLSISSSLNFNRRSLLAHSISSNEKTSSSNSSLSQPVLNLKEFVERELTNQNSSSESGSLSKQPENDKGHRTSTPLTKHSSSKSLYLSIDAQSNLFSGESQISSVKSNTTTSTWESV